MRARDYIAPDCPPVSSVIPKRATGSLNRIATALQPLARSPQVRWRFGENGLWQSRTGGNTTKQYQ